MKFGGTSVGDADCFRRASTLVAHSTPECLPVVVVSAMGGITNTILNASERAASGDDFAGTQLGDMLQCRHASIAHALVSRQPECRELQLEIKTLASGAAILCDAIATREADTLRLRDALVATGERLAARLLAAALVEQGHRAVAIDATSLIVTSEDFGQAEVDLFASGARIRAALRPLLDAGVIPVITGFIGSTADGSTTTLGRGGSDYSATILGACLSAASVVIWSDVDGVMTADPKLVPDARTITHLSYGDATALAEAGAKVIHPKTLKPLETQAIPVEIRNSFAPEKCGTWITKNGPAGSVDVRAISVRLDSDVSYVSLLNVEESGDRIAAVLDEHNIEFSIDADARCGSIRVATSDLKRCIQQLHDEFDLSLRSRQNPRLEVSRPSIGHRTLFSRRVAAVAG
jgi:aspartate kinase